MIQPSWVEKYRTDPKIREQITILKKKQPNNNMGQTIFTGYGGDNRLQPEKPVKIFNTIAGQRAVHEGEMMNIDNNGGFEVLPANKIDQRKMQEMIRRKQMPGYQTGTISSPEEFRNRITSSLSNISNPLTDLGKINFSSGGANITPPPPPPQITPTTPTIGTTTTTTKDYWTQKLAEQGYTPGVPKPMTGTEVATRSLASTGYTPGVPRAMTPEQIRARQTTISPPPPPPPPPPETDFYDRKAKAAITGMEQYTTPEFLRTQISNVLTQLSPYLQTQMTLTAMQIAQDPNMTEGAKRTAMAEALRNSGVAEYQAASDMANKTMDLALQATGKVGEMAARGREFGLEKEKFDWGKMIDTANVQLKAGDIKGFAQTWADAGITINTEVLQDEATADKLRTNMTNLFTNINSNVSFENSQDILHNIAETQNIPDDQYVAWAQKFWDDAIIANSVGYQIWGSWTEDDFEAVFGTDMDTFTYGDAIGIAGARKALAWLTTTNGIDPITGVIDAEALEQIFTPGGGGTLTGIITATELATMAGLPVENLANAPIKQQFTVPSGEHAGEIYEYQGNGQWKNISTGTTTPTVSKYIDSTTGKYIIGDDGLPTYLTETMKDKPIGTTQTLDGVTFVKGIKDWYKQGDKDPAYVEFKDSAETSEWPTAFKQMTYDEWLAAGAPEEFNIKQFPVGSQYNPTVIEANIELRLGYDSLAYNTGTGWKTSTVGSYYDFGGDVSRTQMNRPAMPAGLYKLENFDLPNVGTVVVYVNQTTGQKYLAKKYADSDMWYGVVGTAMRNNNIL